MVSRHLQAFMDYRGVGLTLSGKALVVVKQLLAGGDMTQEDSGMSKREWRELMVSLGRPAD